MHKQTFRFGVHAQIKHAETSHVSDCLRKRAEIDDEETAQPEHEKVNFYHVDGAQMRSLPIKDVRCIDVHRGVIVAAVNESIMVVDAASGRTLNGNIQPGGLTKEWPLWALESTHAAQSQSQSHTHTHILYSPAQFREGRVLRIGQRAAS